MTEDDWRIQLFGPYIQQNGFGKNNDHGNEDNSEEGGGGAASSSCKDIECPPEEDSNHKARKNALMIPTQDAFDTDLYDYIAIFIGANYCPHCKAFAPTVVEAATSILQPHKRCKVVFVSNDRDEDNFQQSCDKVAGIDVMPYNLDRTKVMRDLFNLKTIPALMILRNEVKKTDMTSKSDFQSGDLREQPDGTSSSLNRDMIPVVTNARNILPNDTKCVHFPWGSNHEDAGHGGGGDHTGANASTMSAMDRLIIRGKYGNWWELGHHANPSKPEEMYMDEHAVRARAGLLNVITWIALMNVFFWNDKVYVQVLFPLVAWEFLTSMTLGLTPVSPIGVLGTLLSIALHPEGPYWKPAKPKRFAWFIGLTLACTCLTLFVLRKDIGEPYYKPLIACVVLTCNVATWLESSVGFCLGCFIYNNYLVKWFELEECEECKL
eukprot:CAMPEP_0119565700 /NCGR_PEP_ID=MMETSP1352-20130426/30915_1 /TAXON_ID=265584 /ORGANISM="Stauroneis constricta, Strain CCMP1120" /LENGTH=435 /DNA_ID=CAMNT_0007614681 /DNA_START=113 /DNA_END=1420 /DNA_ORIENTATION=+